VRKPADADKTSPGIYLLEADTLKICFAVQDRPTDFKARPKDFSFLFVLKRVQGEDGEGKPNKD
jgi:hypothetical protein